MPYSLLVLKIKSAYILEFLVALRLLSSLYKTLGGFEKFGIRTKNKKKIQKVFSNVQIFAIYELSS